MRLRRLAHSDLETIRALRNQNREAFFDSREISRDAQKRRYAALDEKAVEFYVIEEDDRVVGTISLTRGPSGIEVGNLLLEQSRRGLGLMRRAIEELTARPGHYFSVVRPDNDASRRAFLANGFQLQSVRLEKIVPS